MNQTQLVWIYKSDSLHILGLRNRLESFTNRGTRERIEQDKREIRSKGRKRRKLGGLK